MQLEHIPSAMFYFPYSILSSLFRVEHYMGLSYN